MVTINSAPARSTADQREVRYQGAQSPRPARRICSAIHSTHQSVHPILEPAKHRRSSGNGAHRVCGSWFTFGGVHRNRRPDFPFFDRLERGGGLEGGERTIIVRFPPVIFGGADGLGDIFGDGHLDVFSAK